MGKVVSKKKVRGSEDIGESETDGVDNNRRSHMSKNSSSLSSTESNRKSRLSLHERQSLVRIERKSRRHLIGRGQHVMVLMEKGRRKIVEWANAEIVRFVLGHNKRGESDEHLPGALTYRDIRQIFTVGSQMPSIEVRRNCILVCLPPVTALVLHNCALLLVTEELQMDSLVEQIRSLTTVADELQMAREDGSETDAAAAAVVKLPSGGKISPQSAETAVDSMAIWRVMKDCFEFKALEILVSAAFEQLTEELEQLQTEFEDVRDSSTSSPTMKDLERLHALKAPLQLYTERVKAFDKTLADLLGNHEDMRAMELTAHYHNPDLFGTAKNFSQTVQSVSSGEFEGPSPDLEILLEYFDQEVDRFTALVAQLTMSVENSERLIGLKLSYTRNSLIYLELATHLIGIGIALSTCLTGIFGMNLESTYEVGHPSSHTFFLAVCGSVCFLCLVPLIMVLVMWWRLKLSYL